MNLEIKTIPYKDQRYETCGDYAWENRATCSCGRSWLTHEAGKHICPRPGCGEKIESVPTLWLRINEMDNEDYEFLVMIHELIEEHLTRRRGLTEPEITAFDLMWEKERAEGKHAEDDEPGHDPRAPYHSEHVLAENIERLLAHSMRVNWEDYSKAVVDSCTVTLPA